MLLLFPDVTLGLLSASHQIKTIYYIDKYLLLPFLLV